MTNLERDLTQAIDEAHHVAAQRDEVRLAWTRALSLTIVTLIGLITMNPDTMVLASGSAALAWMIVGVARDQRYRHWVSPFTSAFDGLLTAGFTYVLEPNQAVALAATALVCTLTAILGAIRVNRWWVCVTTSVAVVNMAYASWKNGLSLPNGLMLCLLIVVAGTMGSWLARISRRALESDVHRIVAGRFIPARVLDAGSLAPLAQLTEARAIDATVLVTDIRSFTTMAETLPPNDVLDFLNEAQGTFAAVVQKHGGSVDKFMGDGMLAVFGLPEPSGDDAARAIAAAHEIAEAARRMAVRIGIGVHSGRVVAGVLGSGSRLELTVVGDTVNIASRLESLTKERHVTALISGSVVERASSLLHLLVHLGPAQIRGRANQVDLYTLNA